MENTHSWLFWWLLCPNSTRHRRSIRFSDMWNSRILRYSNNPAFNLLFLNMYIAIIKKKHTFSRRKFFISKILYLAKKWIIQICTNKDKIHNFSRQKFSIKLNFKNLRSFFSLVYRMITLWQQEQEKDIEQLQDCWVIEIVL